MHFVSIENVILSQNESR